MKVAFIHPSRGRPERAAETAMLWLDHTESTGWEYRLAVESIEAPEYLAAFAAVNARFGHRMTYLELSGPRLNPMALPPDNEIPGFLTATTKGNALVGAGPADWFVGVADGFRPRDEWFEKIFPLMAQYVGTETVIAYETQFLRGLISHPIFTPEFFRWNGNTVMHPEYSHTHGDRELFEVAVTHKKVAVVQGELFKHSHPYIDGHPEDALFRQNYSRQFINQASRLFEQRKKRGFDLCS